MNEQTSKEAEFNVLRTITQIAKKLEDSKLSVDILEEIKLPLQNVANYLNVATDSNETIIFIVVFVLLVKNDSVDLRSIIHFLDITYIDTLNLKSDIDNLIGANLIEVVREYRSRSKKMNFSNASYTVSENVSNSIYTNKVYLGNEKELLDIYEFIKCVSDHIAQRGNDQINSNELFCLVEELEISNTQLESITEVRTLLEIDDRILLYEILQEQITGYPCLLEKTLRDIYQNPRKRLLKVREFVDRTNRMCDLEYITLGESKFANDSTLSLSSKAFETLMKDDAELFLKNTKFKNVLLNEDIKFKELFYESNQAKEVNFLIESLKCDNFVKLQLRLLDNNLTKGVAAIFYGSPGTGKTETVYQIAKATCRDIMFVDIAQTKSMWYGESEKLIKEIFESYKKICNNKKTIPILLFNEADAILNKRHENSDSNIGQTENAIQNILLEELEKFEGILIATTNLAGNLDAAYERRFLFKLKFNIPAVEVKSKIWKTKLSWINDDFIQKLASEFSFSGGEIDNVVRKIIMQEVLLGVKPESNEIYSLCLNEKKLSNKSTIKVGY